MSIWFIVWLLGAILSAYFEYKYAEVHKMLKHIWEAYKKQNKTSDKVFILASFIFVLCVAIPGYIALSWFGAFATYVIFNDFDNR